MYPLPPRRAPGRRPRTPLRVLAQIALTLAAAAAALAPVSASALEPEADDAGIIGRAYSSSTGSAVAFCSIICFRTDADPQSLSAIPLNTTTDADGTYRIETAPGTYKVQATLPGYSRIAVTDVVVTEGQFTVLDLPLTAEALRLETVEVSASAIRNNEAAFLVEQKNAPVIRDGLSADMLKRTTDSNAAEAVNRVTGLSVVGGKFVVVRGLSERYSQTKVNGNSIGSPEPNKRVVPLDLFPAGLIQNISVIKSYSPDQAGDFGGGIVDITTLDFPLGRTWSFSASGGSHGGTTGSDFLTYRGGDADYWGFADATRDVPNLIEELAPSERVFLNESLVGSSGGFDRTTIERIGRSFNNVWNPGTEDGSPKHSYSASYGDRLDFLGRDLGFQGSFTLSRGFQTQDFDDIFYNQTSVTAEGDSVLSQRYNYSGTDYESSTLWGGLFNTSYRIASGHTLNIHSMYTRSSDDLVRQLEGENFDRGREIRSTRLRYIERGVFLGSAGMTNTLPFLNNAQLDWRGSYSWSERNEPDRRDYVYEGFDRVNDETGLTETVFELSRRQVGKDLVRFYNYLDDYDRSASADLDIPFFAFWNGLESSAKVGAFHSNRDRRSDIRRFGYRAPNDPNIDFSLSPEELLVDENIGGGQDKFRIDEATEATDSYVGRHEVTAGYAMADLPFTGRFRMLAGARIEKSRLVVTTRDPFALAAPIEARLDDTDVLPAANATFAATNDLNLRLGYSRTLNRPDMRELTPAAYTEYESGASLIGNPDLVRTAVDNYDFRADFYPGPSEIVAASVFYKQLDAPIELSLQPVAGNPAYKPVNAEDGYLFGSEFEVRVGLGRLTDALSSLSFATNLTLVKSEANIRDAVGTGGGNVKARPLNGQAPYVYNAGLFFQDDTGRTSASLLYNVFGRRLRAAGLQDTPDTYEKPRSVFDVSASRRLGSMKLKIAAENLLDTDSEFTQEAGSAQFTSRRETTGRTFALSLSYGS